MMKSTLRLNATGKVRKKILLSVFAYLCLSVVTYAQLKIYPALSGMQGCQFAYALQAKESGTSTWNNVPLYNILVTNPAAVQVNSTVGNFDCSNPVDIKITYSSTVTSANVYPESLGINPVINGNTITFTIPGPEKFYVNINGDHYNGCMHILANPVEVNPPSPSDTNVVFIATGTFIDKGVTVENGKTLYIQGGAAVRGIYVDGKSNIKILGRGFVYRADYNAIDLQYANNVTIDGIIGLNHGWGGGGGCGMRFGNSTNISVSNTASFSSKKWGDGYDIISSNGVFIDDVFIRTNDDAITFYGGGVTQNTGDCKNISVTNSTLLPDLASSIHIGVYGDDNPTEIRDVFVSNVDIDNWSRSTSQGCILFMVNANVRAANQKFSNIRVNDYVGARFIQMNVAYWSTYGSTPGREIDSIYYTNCSYSGSATPFSPISGYDTGRIVKNVFFQDTKINGTTITSASQGNISLGGYTNNIMVASSSLPSPWETSDIGDVGAIGSTSYSNGTFAVTGSGADIWDTADEFRYTYQSLSGDGEIKARVESIQNTNGWAKAGVMIRETLSSGSKHALVAVTSSHNIAFQRRTSTNGASDHTGTLGSAPYWVRLVRSGSTFTAYRSSNGSNWTNIGSATIPMATNVYVGLAVTSHADETLCTGSISNVTVSLSGSAPVITSATSASCTQGLLYSYTITAANLPTSYNATGLPPGLSVNTSTGVISGTPSSSGTFSVTISAANAFGTGSVTLTMTISTPPTLDGTYIIVAQNSNKAVDVSGASTADGASVIQWTNTGSANQQWVITNLSDNDYKVISVNSGKAMSVIGNSTEDGAKIEQRTYSGNNSQIWTITDNGDGTYKVIGKASGKSLDVTNGSTEDDALMEIWPYTGGTNQKFILSSTVMKAGKLEEITSVAETIKSIKVYPIPVTDLLTVNLLGSNSNEVKIEIYNTQGMLVGAQNIMGSTGLVDMSNLLSGIYVIKLNDSEKTITTKVIKK